MPKSLVAGSYRLVVAESLSDGTTVLDVSARQAQYAVVFKISWLAVFALSGLLDGQRLLIQIELEGASPVGAKPSPGSVSSHDRLFLFSGPLDVHLKVGGHSGDDFEKFVVDVAYVLEVAVTGDIGEAEHRDAFFDDAGAAAILCFVDLRATLSLAFQEEVRDGAMIRAPCFGRTRPFRARVFTPA